MAGFGHHLLDHSVQAQMLAVMWGINAGYPAALELGNLLRDNYAAAAPKYPYIFPALFPQSLQDVFEELIVSTLIGRDSDCMSVFL